MSRWWHRLRRVVLAPEIMLTPGEAIVAALALCAGPIGVAAIVVYLFRRAEQDRTRTCDRANSTRRDDPRPTPPSRSTVDR